MRSALMLSVFLGGCSLLLDTEGLTGDAAIAANVDTGVSPYDGGVRHDVDPSESDAIAGEATTADVVASDGEDVDANSTVDSAITDTSTVDVQTRTTCLPGASPLVSGPKRGGAATSRSGTGDVSWVLPLNALDLDGSSSSSFYGIGDASEELLITGFGITLPTTTVAITGIEVTITRGSDDGEVRDHAVQLSKGGFQIGTAKAKNAYWPTSPASTTYGSSADTWGASLAPEDVSASDFGITIRAESVGIDSGRVDDVRVKVFYCN